MRFKQQENNVKISSKFQITTNKIGNNYIPWIEKIFPANLQNAGRLFTSHRITKVSIVLCLVLQKVVQSGPAFCSCCDPFKKLNVRLPVSDAMGFTYCYSNHIFLVNLRANHLSPAIICQHRFWRRIHDVHFPIHNFLEIGLLLTGTNKRSLNSSLLKTFNLIFNQRNQR